MFYPLKKNKLYFVKTITFYYVATFKAKHGDLIEFKDVGLVKDVADWSEFYRTKAKGELHTDAIYINTDAIVDVTPWG